MKKKGEALPTNSYVLQDNSSVGITNQKISYREMDIIFNESGTQNNIEDYYDFCIPASPVKTLKDMTIEEKEKIEKKYNAKIIINKEKR